MGSGSELLEEWQGRQRSKNSSRSWLMHNTAVLNKSWGEEGEEAWQLGRHRTLSNSTFLLKHNTAWLCTLWQIAGLSYFRDVSPRFASGFLILPVFL